LVDSDFNQATSSANPSALSFSSDFSATRSSSWAFKDVLSVVACAAIPIHLRSIILQRSEAKSPSEQDIRGEETVLTSHIFELRGQLPVFFLQRKEVLADLR
jgi:hypothetical protein